MTAFLPQHDPLRITRAAGLDLARMAYRYDYTHVSPLAMVEHVPVLDDFSHGWMLQVADQVLQGLANMSELDEDRNNRDFHLAQRSLLISLVQRVDADFTAIRRLIAEALRFDGRIGAVPRRAESLDEFAGLFRKIGLPPVSRDYQQDEVFAEMRVAGPNPVMIQRMAAADPRFPVTDADLATIAPGDTLAAAMAEGRLYLADYAVLDNAELGDYPNGQKYVYAPLALFVVDRTSQKLLPVAIQCRQQPGADNPVFNSRDGYNWLIAKTIVEIADGNIHEAMTHLGRTHLLMEPFVVSTVRQLAVMHPLFQLLRPHFEGTLAINDAAWKNLIASKGAVDKLMGGSINASRAAAVKAVQTTFEQAKIPKAFAARGVDDASCLPSYPYRDDSILYWNAIGRWVAAYVAVFYNSDSDVAEDFELQNWYRELKSSDGGRISGLGDGNALTSRAGLIEILTTIIYTCSAQHAAVNFPQYDLMSYVPNMPLAGYAPAPTTKQGATQADYLAMLPPLDMAELQLNVGFLLGGVHYTTLGEYGPLRFRDDRLEQPLAAFQKELSDIGQTIAQRNMQRRPYSYLVPAGIPQSINI